MLGCLEDTGVHYSLKLLVCHGNMLESKKVFLGQTNSILREFLLTVLVSSVIFQIPGDAIFGPHELFGKVRKYVWSLQTLYNKKISNPFVSTTETEKL